MQLAVPRCSCLRKSSSSSASANKVWWVYAKSCSLTSHMVHGFAEIHCRQKAKLALLQNHHCRNVIWFFLCLHNLLHILVCYSPHTLYPISHPNQDPSAYPQPTSQDLAGLWDLLQLNIEDVRVKFQDLHRLKDSGWRLPPEKKVRGPGVQTALVSLQHSPRAKMAVCRRVAQMVVPSKSLQAVKVQSSKRNWAEMPITVES